MQEIFDTSEHPTIAKLREDIEEIQDGLIEIAEMTANNEASMEDIQDAIVELGGIVSEILGG